MHTAAVLPELAPQAAYLLASVALPVLLAARCMVQQLARPEVRRTGLQAHPGYQSPHIVDSMQDP